MKTDTFVAYLLHRRPYRESSWLVDCFSKELGRIRLIARTGGKKNTKAKGDLQVFIPLEIQINGRGDLKYLRQFEPLSLAIPLQGEALYCALYLNELLYYLLQSDLAQPTLFYAYQDSIIELASVHTSKEQPRFCHERILRKFEFVLLTELGFALVFDECNDKSVQPHYIYDYVHGFGLVEREYYKHREHGLSGEILLELAAGKLETQSQLTTAKLITRTALAPLLKGRELNSRKLFVKS